MRKRGGRREKSVGFVNEKKEREEKRVVVFVNVQRGEMEESGGFCE